MHSTPAQRGFLFCSLIQISFALQPHYKNLYMFLITFVILSLLKLLRRFRILPIINLLIEGLLWQFSKGLLIYSHIFRSWRVARDWSNLVCAVYRTLLAPTVNPSFSPRAGHSAPGWLCTETYCWILTTVEIWFLQSPWCHPYPRSVRTSGLVDNGRAKDPIALAGWQGTLYVTVVSCQTCCLIFIQQHTRIT